MILSSFIIERCDNALANIPLGNYGLRRYVYELSMKAYGLYMYFIMTHAFTWYECTAKVKVRGSEDIKGKIEEELKKIREEPNRYLRVCERKGSR